MTAGIWIEPMSGEFVKYHLGHGRAVHHFTGPDRMGPHDHPAGFDAQILFGGYVERHWFKDEHNVWRSVFIERRPHDVFHIDATHIHEIVRLFEPYSLTLFQTGPHERETRFWHFDKGVARSRPFHNHDWRDE